MLCLGMWIAVIGGLLAWTYVGGQIIGCLLIWIGVLIASTQEAKLKKRIKALEDKNGNT